MLTTWLPCCKLDIQDEANEKEYGFMKRIIIDADTGVDDSLAILYFRVHLWDVLGHRYGWAWLLRPHVWHQSLLLLRYL